MLHYLGDAPCAIEPRMVATLCASVRIAAHLQLHPKVHYGERLSISIAMPSVHTVDFYGVIYSYIVQHNSRLALPVVIPPCISSNSK